MTQGNIASWKMKEGDSYSAGDVILEIETDKATMDVEAQDDGILGKILVQDGEKNVSVGTKIAIMAEERDDLSSLEVFKDSKPGPTETKAEEPNESKPKASEEEPRKEAAHAKTTKKTSKSTSLTKDGNGHGLSPAVQSLLMQYNIDNVKDIPTTGPRGRLTKGDVLTYAKQIDAKAAKEVAKAYSARSKLDLSNIKKAPKQEPKAVAPTTAAAAQEETNHVIEIQRRINMTEIFRLSQKFSQESGVDISIADLAAKAAAKALRDVPSFGLSRQKNEDVLFAEIVGYAVPTTTPKLHPLKAQTSQSTSPVPDLIPLASGSIKLPQGVPTNSSLSLQETTTFNEEIPLADPTFDFIDYLTGRLPAKSPKKSVPSQSPRITASLSCDAGSADPKIASIYLDRVAQYIESPAHLLL